MKKFCTKHGHEHEQEDEDNHSCSHGDSDDSDSLKNMRSPGKNKDHNSPNKVFEDDQGLQTKMTNMTDMKGGMNLDGDLGNLDFDIPMIGLSKKAR